MRFGVGNYRFRPRLAPTLTTLLLLPVLYGLGTWQLQRAEEKRGILQEYEQRRQAPPLVLDGSMIQAGDIRYRRVTARGVYDTTHQFMLDNRIHKGIPGYHVLSPLRIKGSDMAVLVNRGWVPLGSSRERLPPVPPPEGLVRIRGSAKTPSKGVFALDPGEAYAAGWPKLVQLVELVDFQGMLNYPLLPVVILLDADERDGYVRDWKPVAMSPDKHTSYAIQWFGLMLLLVIIYLAVNTSRVRPEGEN